MATIKFEKMTTAHLELWNKWIAIPHVMDVWFIEGYEPAEYMGRKLAGNGYDFPFIILLNDRAIGFIQTSDLYAYRMLCQQPKGVFREEAPGTFCLDLFIADENLLGKGLGTKIVQAFTKMLIKDFNAKKIVIDPAADNTRAIRCYEKAGFQKTGVAHDGVCEVVLMQWQPTSVRECVRVILLNQNNELLLLHADDPSTTTSSGRYNGPFWFLVGGQIESGESIEEAAIRETLEETGIGKTHVQLGPIVWKGEFDLIINGVLTRQKQSFIVAKTNDTKVSLDNLTKQEQGVIKDIRWFSWQEINESSDLIYPLCLKKQLPEILAGHYPDEPIEIDLGENPLP